MPGSRLVFRCNFSYLGGCPNELPLTGTPAASSSRGKTAARRAIQRPTRFLKSICPGSLLSDHEGAFAINSPGRGHSVIHKIPVSGVLETPGMFADSLGQNDCPIEHSQNSRISRSALPAEARFPGPGPAAEALETSLKMSRGHAESRLPGNPPRPARHGSSTTRHRQAIGERSSARLFLRPAPARHGRPKPRCGPSSLDSGNFTHDS